MSQATVRIPVEFEVLKGSLDELQNSLSKIKVDSPVGKDLKKSLDDVTGRIKQLREVSSQGFVSKSQLDTFVKAFDSTAKKIQDTYRKLANVDFGSLNLGEKTRKEYDRLTREIESAQGRKNSYSTTGFKQQAYNDLVSSKFGQELMRSLGTRTDGGANGKGYVSLEEGKKQLDAFFSMGKSVDSVINALQSTISTSKKSADAAQITMERMSKVMSDEMAQGTQLSKFVRSFMSEGQDIVRGHIKRGSRSKFASNDKARLGLPDASFKYQDLENLFYDSVTKQMRSLESIKPEQILGFISDKKTMAHMAPDIKESLTKYMSASRSFDSAKADADRGTQRKVQEASSLIEYLQNYRNMNYEGGLKGMDVDIQNAATALENFKRATLSNAGFGATAANQIRALSQAMQQNSATANQASSRIDQLRDSMNSLSRIQGAITSWFSLYKVITTSIRAVKDAIKNIRELDKVMTDIAVVTKMSQSDLWGQISTYTKMAQQYGVSVKGVYEVSQIFYQQGLATNRVMQMTTETLKLAKIAGLDYSKAADYMTVAVRAFKIEMEDAQRVTDVYSALAATTASSTEELATAMSKTASSAASVGASFENTTAMMSVMIANTREGAENIGSALKSIISRYGTLKKDLSATADEDGQALNYNDVDAALKSVGISIKDATGQFRNFDEVILELSKKWQTLDTLSQRYIATQMAGNRQQSRFLALVDNYDDLKEAMSTAANAENASVVQTLKTMDSLETKIQQVKNSFQQLYTNLGIEKLIKNVLTYSNTILQNFNKLGKTGGPLRFISYIQSMFTSLRNIFRGSTDFFKGIYNRRLASELEVKARVGIKQEQLANEIENAFKSLERQVVEIEIGNKEEVAEQVATVVEEGSRTTSMVSSADRGQAAAPNVNFGSTTETRVIEKPTLTVDVSDIKQDEDSSDDVESIIEDITEERQTGNSEISSSRSVISSGQTTINGPTIVNAAGELSIRGIERGNFDINNAQLIANGLAVLGDGNVGSGGGGISFGEFSGQKEESRKQTITGEVDESKFFAAIEKVNASTSAVTSLESSRIDYKKAATAEEMMAVSLGEKVYDIISNDELRVEDLKDDYKIASGQVFLQKEGETGYVSAPQLEELDNRLAEFSAQEDYFANGQAITELFNRFDKGEIAGPALAQELEKYFSEDTEGIHNNPLNVEYRKDGTIEHLSSDAQKELIEGLISGTIKNFSGTSEFKALKAVSSVSEYQNRLKDYEDAKQAKRYYDEGWVQADDQEAATRDVFSNLIFRKGTSQRYDSSEALSTVFNQIFTKVEQGQAANEEVQQVASFIEVFNTLLNGADGKVGLVDAGQGTRIRQLLSKVTDSEAASKSSKIESKLLFGDDFAGIKGDSKTGERDKALLLAKEGFANGSYMAKLAKYAGMQQDVSIDEDLLNALSPGLGDKIDLIELLDSIEENKASIEEKAESLNPEDINTQAIIENARREASASIANSFGEEITAIEKNIIANLSLGSMMPRRESDYDSDIRSINDEMTSEMNSDGINASRGLATGILEGKSEVVSAAAEVANAVPNTDEEILQIKSPSRVMEAIGRYISAGMALGILNGRDDVLKAIEEVVGPLGEETKGLIDESNVEESLKGIYSSGKYTDFNKAIDTNGAQITQTLMYDYINKAAEHASELDSGKYIAAQYMLMNKTFDQKVVDQIKGVSVDQFKQIADYTGKSVQYFAQTDMEAKDAGFIANTTPMSKRVKQNGAFFGGNIGELNAILSAWGGRPSEIPAEYVQKEWQGQNEMRYRTPFLDLLASPEALLGRIANGVPGSINTLNEALGATLRKSLTYDFPAAMSSKAVKDGYKKYQALPLFATDVSMDPALAMHGSRFTAADYMKYITGGKIEMTEDLFKVLSAGTAFKSIGDWENAVRGGEAGTPLTVENDSIVKALYDLISTFRNNDSVYDIASMAASKFTGIEDARYVGAEDRKAILDSMPSAAFDARMFGAYNSTKKVIARLDPEKNLSVEAVNENAKNMLAVFATATEEQRSAMLSDLYDEYAKMGYITPASGKPKGAALSAFGGQIVSSFEDFKKVFSLTLGRGNGEEGIFSPGFLSGAAHGYSFDVRSSRGEVNPSSFANNGTMVNRMHSQTQPVTFTGTSMQAVPLAYAFQFVRSATGSISGVNDFSDQKEIIVNNVAEQISEMVGGEAARGAHASPQEVATNTVYGQGEFRPASLEEAKSIAYIRENLIGSDLMGSSLIGSLSEASKAIKMKDRLGLDSIGTETLSAIVGEINKLPSALNEVKQLITGGLVGSVAGKSDYRMKNSTDEGRHKELYELYQPISSDTLKALESSGIANIPQMTNLNQIVEAIVGKYYTEYDKQASVAKQKEDVRSGILSLYASGGKNFNSNVNSLLVGENGIFEQIIGNKGNAEIALNTIQAIQTDMLRNSQYVTPNNKRPRRRNIYQVGPKQFFDMDDNKFDGGANLTDESRNSLNSYILRTLEYGRQAQLIEKKLSPLRTAGNFEEAEEKEKLAKEYHRRGRASMKQVTRIAQENHISSLGNASYEEIIGYNMKPYIDALKNTNLMGTMRAAAAISSLSKGSIETPREDIDKLDDTQVTAIGKNGQIETLASSTADDVNSGFTSGIIQNINAYDAVAQQAAVAFINAFKSIMGINSPSKVMQEIALFCTEGLSKGFVQGEKGVLSTVEALAGELSMTTREKLSKIFTDSGLFEDGKFTGTSEQLAAMLNKGLSKDERKNIKNMPLSAVMAKESPIINEAINKAKNSDAVAEYNTNLKRQEELEKAIPEINQDIENKKGELTSVSSSLDKFKNDFGDGSTLEKEIKGSLFSSPKYFQQMGLLTPEQSKQFGETANKLNGDISAARRSGNDELAIKKGEELSTAISDLARSIREKIAELEDKKNELTGDIEVKEKEREESEGELENLEEYFEGIGETLEQQIDLSNDTEAAFESIKKQYGIDAQGYLIDRNNNGARLSAEDANKVAAQLKDMNKGNITLEANGRIADVSSGVAYGIFGTPAPEERERVNGYRKQMLTRGALNATQMLGSYLQTRGAGTVDKSDDAFESSKAQMAMGGAMSLASSIGTGLMTGGPWGAAIAAVGQLPNIISTITTAIDAATYTLEERLENLDKERTDNKNEYLQAKSESDSLESAIEKYQALRKARHDSTEALEEYNQYVTELADTYPDLISGYDSEGVAIISLTKMWDNLLKKEKETLRTKKEYLDLDYEQKKLSYENVALAFSEGTLDGTKKLDFDGKIGNVTDIKTSKEFVDVSQIDRAGIHTIEGKDGDAGFAYNSDGELVFVGLSGGAEGGYTVASDLELNQNNRAKFGEFEYNAAGLLEDYAKTLGISGGINFTDSSGYTDQVNLYESIIGNLIGGSYEALYDELNAAVNDQIITDNEKDQILSQLGLQDLGYTNFSGSAKVKFKSKKNQGRNWNEETLILQDTEFFNEDGTINYAGVQDYVTRDNYGAFEDNKGGKEYATDTLAYMLMGNVLKKGARDMTTFTAITGVGKEELDNLFAGKDADGNVLDQDALMERMAQIYSVYYSAAVTSTSEQAIQARNALVETEIMSQFSNLSGSSGLSAEQIYSIENDSMMSGLMRQIYIAQAQAENEDILDENGNIKYEKFEEYIGNAGNNRKANETFLGFYKGMGKSRLESLSADMSNFGAYGSAEEFVNALQTKYGFSDEEMKWIGAEAREQFEAGDADRKWLNEAFGDVQTRMALESDDLHLAFSKMSSITNGNVNDYRGEIGTEYAGEIAELWAKNVTNPLEAGSITAAENAAMAISSVIAGVAEKNLDAAEESRLVGIAAKGDWSDQAGIEAMIKAYEEVVSDDSASEEAKALALENIKTLKEYSHQFYVSITTALSNYSTAVDTALENASKVIDNESKGITKISDATESLSKINSKRNEKDKLTFNDVFKWSDAVNGYVYTAEGFAAAVQAENQSAEDAAETLIANADAVNELSENEALKELSNETAIGRASFTMKNGKRKWDFGGDNQAADIVNSIEGQIDALKADGNDVQAQALEQFLLSWVSSGQAFNTFFAEWTRNGAETAANGDAIREAAKQISKQNLITGMFNNVDLASIVSGTITTNAENQIIDQFNAFGKTLVEKGINFTSIVFNSLDKSTQRALIARGGKFDAGKWMYDILKNGGQEAADLLSDLAEQANVEVNYDLVKSAFESNVDTIGNAITNVASTAIGESLDETTSKLLATKYTPDELRNKGIDLLYNTEGVAYAVIRSVDDLGVVMQDLYNDLENSGNASTSDLNAAYSAILQSVFAPMEGLDSILSNGFSYTSMESWATANNIRLNTIFDTQGNVQEEFRKALKSNGNGTYDILDFKAYVKALDADIDETSQEYIDAYTEWLSNSSARTGVEELSSIAENYTSISAEVVGNIAKLLNVSFDKAIAAIGAVSNGDGTYRTNVEQVLSFFTKEMAQASDSVRDALIGMIDSLTSQVTTFASAKGSGFDSADDINKFIEDAQAMNISLSTSDFVYDTGLETWVLNVEEDFDAFLLRNLGALGAALEKAGYNSDEVQKYLADRRIKMLNENFSTSIENGENSDPTIMLGEVFENFNSLTSEQIVSFANSIGVGASKMANEYFKQIGNSDAFALDVPKLTEAIKNGTIKMTSTLYDSILTMFEDIASELENGLGGTMSRTSAEKFSASFGLNLDADFSETANGMRMTRDAALEVYNILLKIDPAKAGQVASKIGEGMGGAAGIYSKLVDNNKKIESLDKKINLIEAERIALGKPLNENDRERLRNLQRQREELTKQNQLLSQMQMYQIDNADSYKFSDGEMPVPMQGGLNAWQSAADFSKALYDAKANKNMMDPTMFYNMVMFASEQIEAAGGTFEIAGMNAADLIEKGMGALTNVDGTTYVDLGSIGVGLVGGADSMQGNVTDAMHKLAQSQIELLDGMIAFLETIVAMEELQDADFDLDGILSPEEIFGSDGGSFTDDWSSVLKKLRKDNEFMTKCESLVFGNHTLAEIISADYDALEDMGIDPDTYQKIMNSLYGALNGEYDLDAVGSDLMSFMQGSGLTSYKIGDVEHFLSGVTIDWGDKNTKKAAKEIADDLGLGGDDYLKNIQAAVDAYMSGNEGELTFEQRLAAALMTDITETKEGKFKTSDGEEFDSRDDALKHQSLLNQEGEMVPEKSDEDGNIYTFRTKNGFEYEYNYSPDGSTSYTCDELLPGQSFTSLQELQDALIQKWVEGHADEEGYRHLTQEELEAQARVEYKIDVAPKIQLEPGADPTSADWKSKYASFMAKGRKYFEDHKDEIAKELQIKPNEEGEYDFSWGDLVALGNYEEKTIALNVVPVEGQSQQLADFVSSPETTPLTKTINLLFKTGDGEEGEDGQYDYTGLAEQLSVLAASAAEAAGVDFSNFESLNSLLQQIINKLAIITGTNISGGTETPSDEDKGNSTPTPAPTAQTTSVDVETSVDTSAIETGTNTISGAVDSIGNFMSTIASSLQKVSTTLALMPVSASLANAALGTVASKLKTMLNGTYTISLKAEVTTTGAKGSDYKLSGPGTQSGNTNRKLTTSVAAKGNVALAGGRGTLMGELGPELVVSNGSYYVVGENGAEFVDLADDAIVFNHLQTRSLLNNGRSSTGRAVTTEQKAVSWAKGNAMKSGGAQAALNSLRQLRAMWAKMADASSSDLGRKAGSGGGGGGGGGGNDNKAYIHDLERWYNLLQQIEKLDEQINLLEAERKNLVHAETKDGAEYVKNLEKALKLLEMEQDRYEELRDLAQSYYDARKKDLEESEYGKILRVMDDGIFDGTVQYEDEGFKLLAELNATKADGVTAKYTAKEQLQLIKKAGFDIGLLKTKSDGTKAKTAEEQVQVFWENIDTWREEIEELNKNIGDYSKSIEDCTSQIHEIAQEFQENQLTVEELLLTAMTDKAQAVIDGLQDELDAIKESSEDYIKGLNDALEKEKALYDSQESNAELVKLQRQLAILERTGGSASEIKALQDQINSQMRDEYFEEQQKEIDAIQEAVDKQIEMLQQQIDIQTEALEYQKENGLFWDEISKMMNLEGEYANWTEADFENYILTNTADFRDKSAEEIAKTMNDNSLEIQKWLQAIEDDVRTLISSAENNTHDSSYASKVKERSEAFQSDYAREYEKEKARLLEERNQGKNDYSDSKIESLAQEKAYRLAMDEEEKREDIEASNYMNDASKSAKSTYTSAKETANDTDDLYDLIVKAYGEDSAAAKALDVALNGTSSAKKAIAAYKDLVANKDKYLGEGISEESYNNMLSAYASAAGITFDKKGNATGGKQYATGLNKASDKARSAYEAALGKDEGYQEWKNGSSGNVYVTTTGALVPYADSTFNSKKKVSSYATAKASKTSTGKVPAGTMLTITGFAGEKDYTKFKATWYDAKNTQRTGYFKISSSDALYDLIVNDPYFKAMLSEGTLPQYLHGGLIDFTGPAWVDGSKSKPEGILSAEDYSLLKSNIFSNSNYSLKNTIAEIAALGESLASSGNGISNENGIVFENVNVTIESGTISSDYDAQRAGKNVMDEMLKIARKTGNISITRR